MAGASLFPKIETLTEDERWSVLLDLMSVPGYSKLFVLGCFAPRVTFLSQQVRALNLVDALCKTGALSKHSQVAVVGAGLAGLTAAAGLAVRGVSVTLAERDGKERLMPIQKNCRHRVVHPHIYDWPADGGTLEQKADIPLLGWEAATAESVAKQIEEKWRSLPAEVGRRITWVEQGILHQEANGRLTLNGKSTDDFAAVILAVGFGLEEGTGAESYWNDTSLDGIQREREGLTWLVSGSGDGGLTDLMRLCIQDFKQESLYSFADAANKKEIARDLLTAEADPSSDFRTVYEQAAAALDFNVKTRGIKVVLNASPERLFTPGSSILNRLVTACLLRQKAFELIKDPGYIDLPVKQNNKRFEVTFLEQDRKTVARTESYDRVLIRHGPASVLEKELPAIWSACEPKRSIWEAARRQQGLDWTRKPLFKKEDFKPGGKKIPPLCLDWKDDIGCVVVARRGDRSFGGTAFVDQALTRLAARRLPRTRRVATESVMIDIGEAFSSPEHYAHALRALCSSEIAVFHVADYDCAAMLLLGIRSVVRRGITITVLSEPLGDAAWAKLPFNLREIKPLSLADGKPAFTERLTDTLEAGLQKLELLDHYYLDLPSYDAVRNLGPRLDDYQQIPPQEQVLILCSFGERYLSGPGGFVITSVDTACGKGKNKVAFRIVETNSPQLVGQRLHEAIRRSQLCVIDWTEWKPNVFYEFGVRLASNEVDPLSILQPDWDAPKKNLGSQRELSSRRQRHAKALKKFFAPSEYSEKGRNASTLVDAVESYVTWIQESSAHRAQRRHGLLSPGFTYRTIRDAIDTRQEPGIKSVAKNLEALAHLMVGQDMRMQGALPALYSENQNLRRQLQSSAAECLLAAWYYLDRRYHLRDLLEKKPSDLNDPIVKHFLDLGVQIQTILKNLKGWEGVRKEVETELAKWAEIGGMT